ncbi:MAG TPA: hypothetical protein VGI40_26820 [Pirellulaceae bacterium]
MSEDELHDLARGGNVSLSLNFGISLLSIFATIAATFLSVELAGKVFMAFFSAGLITMILGVFFLIKGIREYRSTGALVKAIKGRLPPSPGVQENTTVVSNP